MSAIDDVLSAPAPLPIDSAMLLLDAARDAYRTTAKLKLFEINLLTLGQTEHGEIDRFDAAYGAVLHSPDFFVDTSTWAAAQKATSDLAGIAGAVGEEGIATGKGTVKQLGADISAGAKKLADDASDFLPFVVLGLVALAVIVVAK